MQTAEACEVHIVECPECLTEILVRDPIRVGDKVKCPKCPEITEIESICGPWRESESPTTHNGESI